jgi:hypothetical protein
LYKCSTFVQQLGSIVLFTNRKALARPIKLDKKCISVLSFAIFCVEFVNPYWGDVFALPQIVHRIFLGLGKRAQHLARK